MANSLSNVKVSGTSAEKTNFESTLTTADAGFEFTIVGGDSFRWDGSAFDVSVSNGAGVVATPDMVVGSIVNDEIANLTTTRQKKDYPSGATAVELSYSQGSTSGNTASTGRAVYVVFNATSDADADGKLALAGARKRIPLGYDYGQLATEADPITRVDVVSEAAEGGHSTLTIDARIAS